MDSSDEENCQTTCDEGNHQVNGGLTSGIEVTLIIISNIHFVGLRLQFLKWSLYAKHLDILTQRCN